MHEIGRPSVPDTTGLSDPRGTAGARLRRIELAGLLLLAALYLVSVLPHLGDDPILGGDEAWIMSAGAKLAEDGRFGSDLFRGFYDAEDAYFFNLPLHHFVLAGVFEVFGVSMVAARAVSVAFGLATLGLTYLLGRRVAGPGAGLAAAALLVLLRLNLAPFSGLTLTDLGATVRYDLIAVPYAVAAVLLIAHGGASPRPLIVFAAGLLLGLATLTQFIGAFLLLPVAAFLLTLVLPRARRVTLVAVLGVGMLLPLLPSGAYVAGHWEAFRGQTRAGEVETEQSRSGFLSPRFYLRQIEHEPRRYELATSLQSLPDSIRDAVERPSARLALLVVGPVAIGLLAYRGRGDPARRLLAIVVIGLVIEFMLFESTKRFVYWVVVVPFLVVAIADLGAWLCRFRPPPRAPAWAAKAAVVVVVTVFAVEGLAVLGRDVRDAGDAPSYAALAGSLREAVPASSGAVIGDNRLWPALRERDYRSLLLLFYHTNPQISRERTTDVYGAFERMNASYLLLSPLSYEVLSRLNEQDAVDFERFMAERAELIDTVQDGAYGPIEIYRLR